MTRWLRAFVTLTCAAFAISANVAFAQAPPAPAAPVKPATPPPPTKPTTPSDRPALDKSATNAIVLDADSLQAIIGRSIESPTGEDMGRIVDMLVPASGQVRAAVIDFGGFLGVGSRKIAVDWKALNFTDVAKSGDIIVALTRNQVRMAPEYKQGDPIVVLEAAPPLPVPKSSAAADPQKK